MIEDDEGWRWTTGGCRRERGKEGERGTRESESRFGFSAGLGGRLVLAVGRAQPCHCEYRYSCEYCKVQNSVE